MYETIDYSIEAGIGLVRLNRPGKLNAISPQVAGELLVKISRRRSEKTRKSAF
ncbi:MAG TPA: hypothetical protein VNF29_13545 [Candidatus Binataceae bacterium]|nr:hypothetical protein [Candidatus Binataceae bacterium]